MGPAAGAFTLIEIMLVVGILGIVLAMGLPPMVRVIQREPLRQAVTDVVQALTDARAQAILQGIPAEVVLQGDGLIRVPMPQPVRLADAREGEDLDWAGVTSARPVFEARLHEEVMVRSIQLNLVEMLEATEVRITFHPNGMSDDFTMWLEDTRGGRETISLDPITGLRR
jgi:prepilin-type N-terminal cleavage/methylation domain-containing protein